MRRLTLLALGAGCAALAAASVGVYLYERPTTLRVAVMRDSDDQAIFAAAAQEFAKAHEQIALKLVAVDTLAESAHAFDEERADLAVVRSDIAMPVNGPTVLIMHRDVALLIAPANSALRSVDDLRGHKVGILKSEETAREGSQSLLDSALLQYEVAPTSVRRVPLTIAELPEAIERQDVDVVLAVDARGSPSLAEAVAALARASGGAPVFIPISDAKAIAARSPNFESIEILRGAFGGAQPKPAETFETLGASTRLIARRSLSNDIVGDLTELILDAKPRLATRVPLANSIEAPPTEKGAALPVHPGALAYLGDEEQSFFEKYSDLIYIGAMLASLFGTGVAALATRFNRRQNMDLDRTLQRLLDIIRVARCSGRLDELDELEREADEILAQSLGHDWNHALSGSRLAATSFALNQARQAIAERRQSFGAPVRPFFAPRIVGE
jgi:TRAP-type uncharacterized transport system substrate-binding protein